MPEVSSLEVRVAIVRIERQRLLDELPSAKQRALEPCLPVIGDVVLGDEQLRLRQAHMSRQRTSDRA